MKKQRHEDLINFFQELLPRAHRNFTDLLRQTDNVIVWLTAFSTGAIALIITKSESILITNTYYIKTTIVFLLLSVICGVVYRTYIYLLANVQYQLLIAFEGFCHGYTCEVNGPIEIKETHTIEDIAKSLKEDMGLDYDHWLEHDYLSRDFWADHYDNWAKHWKRSEEQGLKVLGKALGPLFNKKPEEAEDYFLKIEEDNNKAGEKHRKYIFICNVSYPLTMTFFGLALITITLGYICA